MCEHRCSAMPCLPLGAVQCHMHCKHACREVRVVCNYMMMLMVITDEAPGTKRCTTHHRTRRPLLRSEGLRNGAGQCGGVRERRRLELCMPVYTCVHVALQRREDKAERREEREKGSDKRGGRRERRRAARQRGEGRVRRSRWHHVCQWVAPLWSSSSLG